MTARFPATDAVAAEVVATTLARPATLGAGRLVCVDGPAGSGKTTLAAALDRAFRDALRSPGEPAGRAQVRSLHLDNLYDGWDGLAAGMATLATSVLDPLRRDEAGHYRRFDWHRMRYAEEWVVESCEVLVVEGVGAGGTLVDGFAEAITLLVWVETPAVVRRERWLARDGAAMAAHTDDWIAQEQAMFEAQRTRERADLVLDGVAGTETATQGRAEWSTGRRRSVGSL